MDIPFLQLIDGYFHRGNCYIAGFCANQFHGTDHPAGYITGSAPTYCSLGVLSDAAKIKRSSSSI
jgi:hypothetical protein